MLGSCDEPLCRAYDVAMLDLDGVVYVGGEAVPGAPQHVAKVRECGMRVAFITNNAARAPGRVAEHLRELGVRAEASDVVTSAQAAARVLAERLVPGAKVVLLGAAGLEEALREASLQPVPASEDGAQAVVTGYGPDVLWSDIMRAAVRVRDGLWWVATNTDHTIPTAYGVAPGNGVLVDAMRRFTGVEPVVAGKPQRPLFDETVRRFGAERPLMVGDRLDTDIEGARSAGFDSLLVLTGVTGLEELVAARPGERPTYLAPDLTALHETQEAPSQRAGAAEQGGWAAQVEAGRLQVSGEGAAGPWWRVVAEAGWRHLDETGVPAEIDHLTVPRP